MDDLVKVLQHLSETGASELDSEWLSDFIKHWRQLNEAERKAMVQLEEIRSKLISKETELSLLQADINMLAVDRDNKVSEIEGLTAHLNSIKDENNLLLQRIESLDCCLEDLRSKNTKLSEEIIKKTEQLRYLEVNSQKNNKPNEEVSIKVKDLEEKIKELESEKRKLFKDRDSLEKEKEGQIKALQDVLDDALESKIKIQTKYEKEVRELQDSSSSLVDDFEWKLRQIESTCKNKLKDKDRQIEEKVKEANQSSNDLTAEKELLEQEKKSVKDQLRQVAHLKSYEAEVTQLRGVTSEQQKSLRAASRQLEQLKMNERIMQDEILSMKKLLEKEKTHLQVVQNSAQRRYDLHEEFMKSKIEKQTNELNAKWEVKLKEEVEKLKNDLSRLHSEEKLLTVESIKLQKEQDISSAKETWERSRQELVQEVSKLKEEVTAKESSFQREISKATTILDRENWELRRSVDKITNKYLEELDAMKESHSEEMDLLRTRYDNALVQIDKLCKRVEEYEKTTRSSDSVETEKDSGFAAGASSQSIVDHTNNDDSECSSEEEESVEESEEAEDSEEEEKVEKKVGTGNDNSNNSIDELREEVASLQDSIETLTLSLVQNGESTANKKDGAKDTPALVSNEGEWVDSTASEPETSISMKSAESSHSSSDADESE